MPEGRGATAIQGLRCVLASNGYTDVSMGGGTKLSRLQEHGCGQYVYADSAGAVVVPPGQLDEVLAEARRIEADDARFRAQIAGEDLAGPVAGGAQER